jgi:hypothetical protein
MILLTGEIFVDSETGLLCWCSSDKTRGFSGVDLVPPDTLWSACPDAAMALRDYRKYRKQWRVPTLASSLSPWAFWSVAR